MFNKHNIDEIRLLPMDSDQTTIAEIRSSFKNRFGDGRYYYVNKSLDFEEGAKVLVLFQYNANIIGFGVLLYKDNDGSFKFDDREYNGYYQFDKKTLHNIESISAEELREIDPNFKKFSQSMQRIDLQFLNKLIALLKENKEIYNKKGK